MVSSVYNEDGVIGGQLKMKFRTVILCAFAANELIIESLDIHHLDNDGGRYLINWWHLIFSRSVNYPAIVN